MITLEQRFMIKDLYRQGVSISEIARQSGHDRKTIRSFSRSLQKSKILEENLFFQLS